MRKLLKNLLRRISPTVSTYAECYSQQLHIRRFESKLGLPHLAERFISDHGCVIAQGPFAGMKYIPTAVGSALLPKLLGIYEMELRDTIVEASGQKPNTIIDVGCAEGYYAIGLAKLNPQSKVYAYDISPFARIACKKLSEINGTGDQVHIRGRCDWKELSALICNGTLIVCDCEGFEWELLDPNQVPSLRRAAMLVELHRGAGLPVVDRFRERFQGTHEIQFINAISRDGTENRLIESWKENDRLLASNEMRSDGQTWAWAKPLER